MRPTIFACAPLACALLQLVPTRAIAAEGEQAPMVLRLGAAIEMALRNYPAMRASESEAAAARAGVGLAHTAYLPRTDLLWQENRATRNNVTGLLLPQSVIPSISGPVPVSTSLDGVWGSAAGVLVSWEPFDFGLRRASVDLAAQLVNQAAAGVELTRLQVATAAADAFLGVLAAREGARAAEANVDRLRVFADAVHVLVDNQLRPGADLSRADAELTAARIQLIKAQRTVQIAHITLAEALGLSGTSVEVDPEPLFTLPPSSPAATPRAETHPLAVAAAAAVETVRDRERVLEKSYLPRVSLQSAFFARGTGAPAIPETGHYGLLPDTANWAVGLSVTFPVFDVFPLRARRQIEAGNEAAERARHDQTILALKAQDARAQALVDAARLVAGSTPIELAAARETEARARARYQAGLANLTEVAEAQRLLAQSEVDDGVARLGVWQALLTEAAARGDLKPFLDLVDAASPTR